MKEIELKFSIFIGNMLITIDKFIFNLTLKNHEKSKKLFKDLYGFYPERDSE